MPTARLLDFPSPAASQASIGARAARRALALGRLEPASSRLLASCPLRSQAALAELDAAPPGPAGSHGPESIGLALSFLGASIDALSHPSSPAPELLIPSLRLWASRLALIPPSIAARSLLCSPSSPAAPLLLRSLRAGSWSPGAPGALFALALAYSQPLCPSTLAPPAEEPEHQKKKGAFANAINYAWPAPSLSPSLSPASLIALYQAAFPQHPASPELYLGVLADLSLEPRAAELLALVDSLSERFDLLRAPSTQPLSPIEPAALAQELAAASAPLLREPRRLASLAALLARACARRLFERPPEPPALERSAAAASLLCLALAPLSPGLPQTAWTLFAIACKPRRPLWLGALARQWRHAFSSRPDLLEPCERSALFQNARRLSLFELTSPAAPSSPALAPRPLPSASPSPSPSSPHPTRLPAQTHDPL